MTSETIFESANFKFVKETYMDGDAYLVESSKYARHTGAIVSLDTLWCDDCYIWDLGVLLDDTFIQSNKLDTFMALLEEAQLMVQKVQKYIDEHNLEPD